MNNTSVTQGEPVIIGDLLPEELQKLAGLRQQSEQIVHQIGLTEVSKQRLLQQLQNAERSAQVVLNQTGARLGIPDGTAWQVTGAGQAIMIAPASQVTPPPEG